ncbi:hypothetical protein KGP26_17460 [Serratia sp. JSRIV002]|uniref:hypothetical protein n=1 Tax=Serratia TaxID=613 RepID=UPI001C479EC7|nr:MULTISPECIES: hypothetical protein [Serratia]QXN61125.1 hypothetical protein J8M99_17470 [Serratia fonticola]UAN49566.1 hypothetical protein KGP26_17460 [Serratia sp. JSRIV002]
MHIIVFNLFCFIFWRFFYQEIRMNAAVCGSVSLSLLGDKRRFCHATRRSGPLAELLDIKNTSIILHFINVVGRLNRWQVAGALLRYAGHR